MKLFLRSAVLTLARFGQSLQALAKAWLPRPAPVLVPIPIRAERRTSRLAHRQTEPRR